MESAGGMYALKPVVALPDQIPLPTVMYELPKIQGGGASSDVDAECQELAPEYDLLEHRQMKILSQICELREQVDYLCIAVRLADINKVPPFTVTNVQSSQAPMKTELIINANPANPPFSILALQRIWKDTKFHINIHHHSSLNNVTTTLFEEKLLTDVKSDAVHAIHLNLIWKDVQDVQLVTKVHDYPLEGEANVLRYLTRLLENQNYEKTKSLPESIIVDNILDICLRLPYEEPRNVNATIWKFVAHLGKNPWLLNSTDFTIVDVAVWSILKNIAHNKVPPQMKNWYDLCEKVFLASSI